ncbi:MAG: CHAT domain-containing protein, partial [Bacteroidales bacterium]|nr:CHAT domain-containing protein [Bacteroidales bacterium]
SQPVSERKFNTDSLEAVVNVLEKELTNYVNLPGFSNVTYKDIRKSLRKYEAAIEFIRFRYYDKEWTDIVLYCALVLRKEYEYPEMVLLFEEKELEKLLYKHAYTDEYNYIKHLYEPGLQKGDSLYTLTWLPLDKYLQDIKTVYISPSGLLNRIAFDAVPYDNQHILSDKYKIVYTSSTAQITDQKKLYAKDIDKAALFGGIEYEADISQMLKEVVKYTSKDEISQIVATRGDYLSLINKPIRGLVWTYLPGSQTEVEKIGNILSDNNKKYDLFTGISGSEEAFKDLSNYSPSVLHISTHGFYFGDDERSNKISQMRDNKLQYIHSKNPLVRSGILFAGAQYVFSGNEIPFNMEDGVLTAYEVSHLNLLNTDLVVLSACQTGLGDVKGSEGVYGLQRAFKMAGVDYLLISLWQVPDYQTRELMVSFYNKWLSGL